MIHLICRAVPGRAEEVLGAVLDAPTLATLQNDGDAMPVGGYLAPIAEYVEGLDGRIACNRDGTFVVATEFHLPTWEAKQAAVDAAIAGLDPETKAAIGMADHVPEVERKQARAAERVAAIAAQVEAVAKP